MDNFSFPEWNSRTCTTLSSGLLKLHYFCTYYFEPLTRWYCKLTLNWLPTFLLFFFFYLIFQVHCPVRRFLFHCCPSQKTQSRAPNFCSLSSGPKDHHWPQLSPFTTALDNRLVQWYFCWTETKTFHPNRIQFNDNLICQTSLEHPVTSSNNELIKKRREGEEIHSQRMWILNNRPVSRITHSTGQSSRQYSPQRRECVILWSGLRIGQEPSEIISQMAI